MRFFRFLLTRHPLPTAVLVIGLAGLSWFGVRFVSELLYFSDPAHQEQSLAPWMSPYYVAKSWDLPREVIIREMQLEPDHKQPTLADVVEHMGITLPELEARIRKAKADVEADRLLRHGGGDDREPPPEQGQGEAGAGDHD
ncbi:hypothetical protein GVN24_01535 [Rhizobium sp. CRIBSB]|nr:hypothetical protein [Rhizobium sp. CRIBSB]